MPYPKNRCGVRDDSGLVGSGKGGGMRAYMARGGVGTVFLPKYVHVVAADQGHSLVRKGEGGVGGS